MGLTLLAVGDSITKGIGATTFDTSYVNLTRKQLLKNGKSHLLVNSAVGGQTASTLLTLHKSKGGKCDPDLVFIMVGTNDIAQGVTSTTFKTNVGLLIDEIKKNSVVGQCKFVLFTTPWRTGYDVTPYNTVINQLGSERNIPVCNTSAAFSDASFLSDGVHPNDAGHLAIANIVIPFLDGLDVWNNTRKR
jgi:lysophospholipase L1-like esterase